MTRQVLAMVCGVLVCSSVLAAQSRGAKPADPITGTWQGEFVREGASNPDPITMELKFDGKGAVSGTATGLPSPADVKSGTFDPKTGVLKLNLGKVGETDTLITLDGEVVQDTASGTISGQASGTFKLAKKK
jgi:hypothetical protein